MDGYSVTEELENSAVKIVQIASGEAHNLALTADGRVYAWGRGFFGRLGTGRDTDELLPVRIPIKNQGANAQLCETRQEEDVKIMGVAAGAYHSLALSDDGSIWSWGYGVYGQLGHGNEESSVPCLVEDFVEAGSTGPTTDNINACNGKSVLKAIAVKAGGMMSLAIDQHGILWIWGHCPQSASENNSDVFCFSVISSPQRVCSFQGCYVSRVACGNEHVLALANHGASVAQEHLICYAWGSNAYGQLGLGDKASRSLPQPVTSFGHPFTGIPYSIACGAFHTAVLTSVTHQTGAGSDEAPPSYQMALKERGSICWTFGLGENGQLGHGTSESKLLPEPVDGLPKAALLKSVECGLFHTCVLSASGDVWVWGMERGLGLCPNIGPPGTGTGDALSPLKMEGESSYERLFCNPLEVACGAAHTTVVTDNGYKVWAWGRGQSGVLGRGSTNDSLVPCLVSWPPPCLGDTLDLKNAQWGQKTMVDHTVKTEDKCMDEDGLANLDKLRLLEMGNRLSSAEEEVKILRSKLIMMERYTNLLHFSIFGNCEYGQNIMQMVRDSNAVDVQEVWEKSLELANHGDLIQLEAFYHTMRTKVKDIILQRKIKEWTRECLNSLSFEGQPMAEH